MINRVMIALVMIAMPFTVYGGSAGVACGGECRLNMQILERSVDEPTNKVYLNVDSYKDVTSGKGVVHLGSDKVHASYVKTFKGSYNLDFYGVGYDVLDGSLLGADVGLDSTEKLAVFVYWGLPVYGKISTDGFYQDNGAVRSWRGNLMWNMNKWAVGYEVTSLNEEYTQEVKAKWRF